MAEMFTGTHAWLNTVYKRRGGWGSLATKSAQTAAQPASQEAQDLKTRIAVLEAQVTQLTEALQQKQGERTDGQDQ